ncbi:MAG: FAD-binding oxidoreductase [Planctomycetota bacterium]|jgi:glycolate oxidase
MAAGDGLLDALREAVGRQRVVTDKGARLVHADDGSVLHPAMPRAIVYPTSTEEVSAVVRTCAEAGVPFVARGAGTGLSGGAIALDGGVIISLQRMTTILSVDPENRRAIVQAGVSNLAVSRAVDQHGLYYAPDPSSAAVCTIGGNVAHNSGGPHTLKYGVTVDHVLALRLVLPDGSVTEVGGPERPGYDLVALLTGSEGTLGIVTEITVGLLREPEAVTTMLAAFRTPNEASRAVAAIIAGGVVPAALEMMDAVVVEALQAAFGFEYPEGAGALLLVEADGPRAGLAEEARSLEAACREAGALFVRVAGDEQERAELWIARKRAFGALGRIARNYYTQDGVIPRTRLPEMLARVASIAAEHRVRVANVFHAGDGNLHPCILFDDRDADETRRVLAAGQEILAACVALGGSLTGEHGVGVEKREAMTAMFQPADLDTMKRLRAAFDPAGLCNPKKLFPTGQGCREVSPRHRQVAV